ncbi:putative T7SS-secreted protein [Streptomyces boluensis]|uniref:Type IV secretion protein Rhs n=1 Tax=Streptomyces boluensis TaxID=1775135 RepID=A0A964UXR2_9ACTN|nr:DUF6531 domain-containing protein [Streptomyces boluensis]NBE54767.1 type IV secretion protein Rhs [Streptomyces boluensis]
MGIGDALDGIGNAASGAMDTVKEKTGDAVGWVTDKSGDAFQSVGMDSAAEGVRDAGEGLANRLGSDVPERQLGETDDPKELIHGSVPALEERAKHLKDFGRAFETVGRGLGNLDSGFWRGEAADRFREKFSMQPKKWLTAADACEDASRALESYAQTVAWAQSEATAAIELYKSAQAASEKAAKDHELKVGAYDSSMEAYDEYLAEGKTDPGPKPTNPGPLRDPGVAGRREAQETLDEARRQRTEAARDARGRVQQALETAPEKPDLLDRAGAEIMDNAQSYGMGLAHFAGGFATALGDTAAMVRTANPLDPYNLTHPAEWVKNANGVATGLLSTAAHPERIPKSFIGAGWTSDPQHALGNFIGNLVGPKHLSNFGKGAGGKPHSEQPSGKGRDEGDKPDSCKTPEKGVCENDPVDMATGRMLLPQTDVSLPGALPLLFSRHFKSSYRAGYWFGPSWASTVDQHLEVDATGVVFVRQDGAVLSYPHPAPGVSVLPNGGDEHALMLDAYGDYMVTDPVQGRSWHFAAPEGDGNGIALLMQITDRSGQYVSFEYAADGAPTGIVHSAGYHLKITTEGKRVTALHLAGGAPDGSDQELVGFGYDSAGHLASVTNPSGLPTRFTNDELGRITSWTDTNDSSYSYVYDDQHRCTYQTGQAGHLRATYTYDDTDPATGHKVTTFTNSLGHTKRYLVNGQLQVVAETDPAGATTHTKRDLYDRPLTVTDPLGRTSSYAYDEAGRVTMVVRPDGAYTSVAYDELSLPVVVAHSDGTCTYQQFDEFGNRVSVTDGSGATTRFGYDALGNLASITDALGSTTRVACDSAGLPLEITDPLGAVTRYERDAFGRPVTVTDPLGAVTRLEWTVEGKLARRTSADGSTESWTYDGEGNCLTHTDAMGAVSSYEYTHFDLLSARTGPDGVRYEFEHDTQLQLRRVLNPQGLTWGYEYDASGRLVVETDFDDRVLTYAHDAAGQLTSRTTPMGDVIRFERDVLGRMVRKDAAGAITTFEYDATGGLARAVNPDAVLEMARDAAGRLVSESVNGRTMTFTYDELGRRVGRKTPSGAESSWRYDAAGNRTELVTSGRTMTFEHDAAGRELSRLIGDSLSLTNSFDAVGRLTKQSLVGPADHLVQQRAYTYRADGNLIGVDDKLNGSRRFDLDAAGRVTAVHAAGWTERYAYDEAGNQTEASWPSAMPGQEAVGPRTYEGTRIRTAGAVRYEHDAGGRTILRQKTRLSRKPDTWRYSWDAEGRLTSVITPDGTRWRYAYDPLGRRISKQRLAPDGETVAEQVDFAWDGTTLCEQTSHVPGALGAVILTWNHQGLHPLSQTERKLGQFADSEVDERFYAIVTDLVGTPTRLFDEQGETAWHTRTTLWGTAVWNRSATAYTPIRFPGQYYDPETGLHYNYFRHYDPEAARYLTPDPLGIEPAPNPVAYAINPHFWIDPLGLSVCETGGFKNPVTPDEVRGINSSYGGSTLMHGSPQNMLANVSRYESFWEKSAVVVRDIAGSHMYDNGNKRTAVAVVEELMQRNNVVSGPTHDDLWRVVSAVGKGEVHGIREIADMLRGYA